MYEKTCKWCGKTMVFKPNEKVRRFCSKLCYGAEKHHRFNGADNGPEMPLLEVDKISDEGVVALIAGIVAQAKDDVLNFAPGTMYREDAEQFFLSEDFAEMTNLDGFDILCRLQDQYDEKQRKKEEKQAHVSASV